MSQAVAIANHLLQQADTVRHQNPSIPAMTPMKALKLVYYAHGWYLGLYRVPLVRDEQVEAWRFGPVFPSLYHAAKNFGNQAITKPLQEIDPQTLQYCVPTLASEYGADASDGLGAWLNSLFQQYGHYDAISLSNATHEPGTPWDEIYVRQNNGNPPRGTDIPRELIEQYFTEWAKTGTPPPPGSIKSHQGI